MEPQKEIKQEEITVAFKIGFAAEHFETKSAVQSLNVEDYNLLDGVSIVDDKDKLDVENIKIKYNGSDDPSTLRVGSNTITLTIKDSWGRESLPKTYNLKLSSAMDDIDITFLYAGNKQLEARILKIDTMYNI